MGVPSFYRWLANRYPKIVVNAVEKTEEEYEYDGSLPNPNGIEFDNLYLDMNGIIHPCFHPEHDDVFLQYLNSPVTYDEVFSNVFEYIDRIMNIVRPRKLLYMAIDGVAPRAKMNQQRTRRFRNAKDRKMLEEEEVRLRKQYEIEGRHVLPKVESNVADSNVITPGTEFMYELANRLQAYIRLRIANHPAWRSLKVILSDASSPGEGEHKIMSFIRRQRACEGYNPNTKHVLYGLDADLIMLALATHEVHFSILRENVLVQPTQANKANFDLKHGAEDTAEQISDKKSLIKKPYQFLHVCILREYLKLDLELKQMPEKFVPDIERLIDDFIFICFFAGNDFLPHMPTLEIHEGAIDLLMHVYTEEFKSLGGYLVDVQRVNEGKGCYIKLKRVEKFILAVGAYEDKIFKKRSVIHDRKLRRILSDTKAAEGNDEDDLFPVIRQTGNVDLPCSSRSPDDDMQICENTKMLKERLSLYARETSDVFKNGLLTDLVKFGSPGWKRRYYKCKFAAETEQEVEKMRKNLVEKYTEGLCWVLLYYFSDVPSWNWYYPYHYGPFASDLKGLFSIKATFKKGSPFKPFDQLMAVLPPTSAHALPTQYQSLMTHEESSILDFYPSDFNTDTDGKRYLWQGICKLPFIDEDRLLSATKKIEKELTEDEAKRNVVNGDQLFIHSSESLASQIISSFEQSNPIKIDISGVINGFVRPMLESNKEPVLRVHYELPCFSPHIPRVLAGSTIPETVVIEGEIEERQLWHDIYGYNNNRNNRSHSRADGSNSNGNTSVGCRNWSPDVVPKGVKSGWNPRGRGRGDHSGTEGSNGSPRVGFRNSVPNVILVGGGTGWNPRGRGRAQQSMRTVNDQTGSQSLWKDTHGRRNARPAYYPARNVGSNGTFWSARSAYSGSSSNQASNRWGETQSRRDCGDASWRRFD